jgi:hypothetical protein
MSNLSLFHIFSGVSEFPKNAMPEWGSNRTVSVLNSPDLRRVTETPPHFAVDYSGMDSNEEPEVILGFECGRVHRRSTPSDE